VTTACDDVFASCDRGTSDPRGSISFGARDQPRSFSASAQHENISDTAERHAGSKNLRQHKEHATIDATGRRNRSQPRNSGIADMIVPTKNASISR
jgi:hypothetical protein